MVNRTYASITSIIVLKMEEGIMHLAETEAIKLPQFR